MIKFFRAIRQNMIKENRASRYLIYAIGEIFLVVIGILIALEINNWNQDRQARIKEKSYIKSLILDLQADTTMIGRQIQLSTLSFNSGMRLDSVVRNRNLYGLEAVHVVDSAQILGRVWLPQFNTNTYDDLINTGNFNLIENKILTDQIQWHYSNLPYQWTKTFGERNEELVRVMVELIPLKFHVAVMASRDSPLRRPVEEVITEAEANEIFLEMINYPKFEFYLKNVTRGHLFHIRVMESLKEGSVFLIQSLQNYYDNLQ